MESNSVTIITVLILLFFCVFPIVLINQKKRNKEKKSLQQLLQLAAENNCTITEHEAFSQIIIGIDKQAQQFFFIRTTPENEVRQAINLKEMSKCRMEETGRSVNGIHVIEKIDLCFSPAAANQKGISVNIYNTDYDGLTLKGELQFADKWAKIVNNYLKMTPAKQ